jgi:TolA-binding protein
MKKSLIAIMTALIITTCVGVSIFAVGGAALFNKNGTTASNSPAQASSSAVLNSPQQADQVAQLQSLVSQYQEREKQYQQREQKLQSQLDQANSQLQSDQQTIQQAQMLLSALEQRGLIRITNDGRIFITQ